MEGFLSVVLNRALGSCAFYCSGAHLLLLQSGASADGFIKDLMNRFFFFFCAPEEKFLSILRSILITIFLTVFKEIITMFYRARSPQMPPKVFELQRLVFLLKTIGVYVKTM